MSKGAYTYEPGNITEFGKDRMRFELGDTMVEGLADTTALTDEEIQAAIDAYPNKWKRAKLMLLESLCRRFAYEVNTKTGPLSLDMNGRAKLWKEDYDKIAAANGITNYAYTAAQNTKMVNLLKKGKLIKA